MAFLLTPFSVLCLRPLETDDTFLAAPLPLVMAELRAWLFEAILSLLDEDVLVMVSCRLRIPLALDMPSPLGVSAPGLARCMPTAARSDTSEATRGRAAPRGDGALGR